MYISKNLEKIMLNFTVLQLKLKKRAKARLICKMAGTAGIEPAMTVLETVAIPFNYVPRQ